MNMFADLKSDSSMEDNTLTTSNKYGPLESGLYTMTIEMAYADESQGGAKSVNFVFKAASGKELKQTMWVTSGKAKGGKNFYLDKEGNKKYIPGYNVVNSICLLTVGKELPEMDIEEKLVSLYDYEKKKEVPTKKPVLMELLGQEITLGVQEVREFKRVRNDDNVYVDSTETRNINEVAKVYRASDNMCVAEIRANTEEASDYQRWADRNTGVIRDKTQHKAAATPKSEASTTETKNLFG